MTIFAVIGFYILHSNDTIVLDEITDLLNNLGTEISNAGGPEDGFDPNAEPLFKENEITFLMLGVDTLEAKSHSGIRTDTIILVNCNFDTGEMNMMSIPRDTRTYVRGKLDKINHAHNYGGVDLTLKSVNAFLKLEEDVEYYVKIDYRAVKEIVDAIGGVDIYVPRRMEYYDPTVDFRVDLYEGQQVLNGDQAMQFLRWRHNNDYTVGYAEGDVGRIETQQYFMKEFIKQTLSTKNILKIPQIVNTYFNRVDTNIPMGDIFNGITLAKKLDSEKIRTETVPGSGQYIGNISYFIYDEVKLKELLVEMGY